jgi:hypothetical protein
MLNRSNHLFTFNKVKIRQLLIPLFLIIQQIPRHNHILRLHRIEFFPLRRPHLLIILLPTTQARLKFVVSPWCYKRRSPLGINFLHQTARTKLYLTRKLNRLALLMTIRRACRSRTATSHTVTFLLFFGHFLFKL